MEIAQCLVHSSGNVAASVVVIVILNVSPTSFASQVPSHQPHLCILSHTLCSRHPDILSHPDRAYSFSPVATTFPCLQSPATISQGQLPMVPEVPIITILLIHMRQRVLVPHPHV